MMCLGLTDGTLTRKYTGLNVLAEVRELKMRKSVNMLSRMKEQIKLTFLSLQSLI